MNRMMLVVLVFTFGCATIPTWPPVPVVINEAVLSGTHFGANDGFHGPLPPDISAYYVNMGPSSDITIRTPQLSLDSLLAYYASVRDLSLYLAGFAPHSRLRTIALIEGPDVELAKAFATTQPDAIENGNELELPPHEQTPQQYADTQGQMYAAERGAGFMGDIIMGGVYTLTDTTKQAITLAIARCSKPQIKPDLLKVGANVDMIPDCLAGVHLYNPTQADVDWLNGLDVDVAVTETGSPTGCGMAKWQEQADYVAGVRALLSGVRRLKYFIIYQRPNGLTCSNYDTFGFQGKPLELLLKQWVK